MHSEHPKFPWPAMTVLIVAAAILVAVLLAGCGNDAHVAGRDTSDAFKINMPDQFNTIAYKCNGPNVVYETSHGALAVRADDPRCKRGATP